MVDDGHPLQWIGGGNTVGDHTSLTQTFPNYCFFSCCGYDPSNPNLLWWGVQREGKKHDTPSVSHSKCLCIQPLLLKHAGFPTFTPLHDVVYIVLYGCKKKQGCWNTQVGLSHLITSQILLQIPCHSLQRHLTTLIISFPVCSILSFLLFNFMQLGRITSSN